MQTTQEEILRKQHHTQEDAASTAVEEVLYKIDVPANRYDMLCLEGIARALNIFLGRISTITYNISLAPGSRSTQFCLLSIMLPRWTALHVMRCSCLHRQTEAAPDSQTGDSACETLHSLRSSTRRYI